MFFMPIFTWQIDVNNALSFINTDILSKIKEWLVLTKDYALELGGRYIQFIIANHIIYIIVFIFTIIMLLILTNKLRTYCDKQEAKVKIDSRHSWDRTTTKRILSVLWWCSCIWFFIWTIYYCIEIVKRKFIPEIQMYQVIMDIKNWPSKKSCN